MRSMRALILTLPLVLVLGGACSDLDQQDEVEEQQEEVCQVTANYQESLEENGGTLLKLLALINSEPSLLDENETFGSYYTMLASTRRYHEDINSDLPPCARPLNQAYIKTISATQDVLAFKLALNVMPEIQRAETRWQLAKEHLNDRWELLSDANQSTNLAVSSN